MLHLSLKHYLQINNIFATIPSVRKMLSHSFFVFVARAAWACAMMDCMRWAGTKS